MTLPDDVIDDLLTVYLAGDASAGTRSIIEARARDDAAFAARLRAAGSAAFPGNGADAPTPDAELSALKRTREFIRLRTIFTAAAILFTALPLTFTFGARGVEFLILGRHEGLVWACWSLAAAAWSTTYVMHRRVGQAGL